MFSLRRLLILTGTLTCAPIRGLLIALAVGVVATAGAVSVQEEATTEEALLEQILKHGNGGELEPISRLANLKTPAALDALVQIYEQVESGFIQNEVLRGYACFDEVDGQQQRALQLLTDAATLSPRRTQRLSAVDLIAGCANLGRPFLALLVDSTADYEVREEAMRRHAAQFQDSDVEWYRDLLFGESESRARGGKRRKQSIDVVPAAARGRSLRTLRALALTALGAHLDSDEVYRLANKDSDPEIRGRAVRELDARDDKRAEKLLEQLFRADYMQSTERLYAAGSLLRREGESFAKEMAKIALRPGQPWDFVHGVADLLDQLNDAGMDRRILKSLTRARGQDQIFWMRAARGLEGEAVDRAMTERLDDEDPRVVRMALTSVAARGLIGERSTLEELVESTDDPEIVAEVVDTMTILRRGDPEWGQALAAFTQNSARTVRNAALRALSQWDDPQMIEVVLHALQHEDWSTRIAAMHALKVMHTAIAVGPLIDRMEAEEGRPAVVLAETLFSLTGQSFGVRPRRWRNWWRGAQAGFEVATAEQLRLGSELAQERMERGVTGTQFFGVRVDSHRVIFVLDVSGSMEEPTQARYVNETGPKRLTLAKEELAGVLDNLDRRTFFNMIFFSGRVRSWKESITAFDEEVLMDAKEVVEGALAGGGTNLFGALARAFKDSEVDTIFVLSDGEPTVGAVVDSAGIRSHVAEWNKNRGIVIHTVAVGGSLKVLEWLAEDTGGNHVRFP